MQNLGSDAKNLLIRNGQTSVSIACAGLDGNLTILSKDIIQGTFYVDRNSISGENIELGNAETTEIGFVLSNSDGRFNNYRFEGAVLTVTQTIGAESLKIGVFTVDEPPKTENSIKITALDNMAKFNKPYVSALTGKQTLLAILQDACYQCNVTLNTLDFLNRTYQATVPSGDITFHQVVAWIAELAGANAWINWDGQLCLSWYGENQGSYEIELPASHRFASMIDEKNITITGLVCAVADQDETVFGTEAYALVIDNNPLLDYADVSSVLTPVWNKINGFVYRPFSATTCGKPHLWPMDKIKFIRADGTSIYTYIMNNRYTLNGTSRLMAKGDTPTVKGYATAAPFTQTQKRIIQNTAKIEAATQVSEYQQSALSLNQLIGNAIGYTETIVTDANGAITRYLHDKPTLAASMNIYKQTSEGFAYTNAGGWPNPTWTSGMTADGNILAKVLSVIGINADWMNVGTIQSRASDPTRRVKLDLENDLFRLGDHLLDMSTRTLIFTSQVTDDIVDFIFKKSGTDKVNMSIDGEVDITVAQTFGSCRIEKRTDTGNEGVDFVF